MLCSRYGVMYACMYACTYVCYLWNLIGEIGVFHAIYMGDSIEDQDLHGEIGVLHAIYMGDSIEDQEMGVITT